MGLLGKWFGLETPTIPPLERGPSGLQFSTTTIDPGTLYGVQSVDEVIQFLGTGGPVSRREAIAVPAVKRGRDIVASGLGQMPLGMYDEKDRPLDWSLLNQPEAGRASVITWTDVIDDLIFHGVAWLRVTHFGWHGRAAEVVRLDPATVSVRPGHRVYVSGSGSGSAVEWVPDDQLIRIDSPNDALLVAGARAIRALSRLEVAGLNAAEGVPPMDYFTPAEGADPVDDEDVTELLRAWAEARRKSATAYIPAALKYGTNAWNPEQLQLIEARTLAIAEVGRLIGVDAEDLGVATSTRTYFNAQDRRRHLLDFTFGPYRRAIESRLSMPDITPRGCKVRFDVSDFSRADDKETAETDSILLDAGIYEVDEIRARRGLEPLGKPAPAPVPEEATA